MIYILCGFFCAGKTTIGQLLAQKLSLPFFDTDRMIEAQFDSRKTVTEVWHERGIEAFRDLESEAIYSLKKIPSIIATGGGSLLRAQNREYLKNLGTSFYLKASIPALYQRVLQRGFPAYLDQNCPGKHFEEIAHKRFPIYEQHCEITVYTESLTETQVLSKII